MLLLVACLVIMIVEDVMYSSSFSSLTRKSSSSSASSVFGGRAERAAARGVEYRRSSNRGARVASSSPHFSVRGDGDGALSPRPSRLVVGLFGALESQHVGKEGICLLEDLAW